MATAAFMDNLVALAKLDRLLQAIRLVLPRSFNLEEEHNNFLLYWVIKYFGENGLKIDFALVTPMFYFNATQNNFKNKSTNSIVTSRETFFSFPGHPS